MLYYTDCYAGYRYNSLVFYHEAFMLSYLPC